jgi:hypothetical protein
MTAPNIPPPASSAIDCDFHFLVVLAEEFGFEGETAFIVAVLLRADGISAGQAARLFREASRWIQ